MGLEKGLREGCSTLVRIGSFISRARFLLDASTLYMGRALGLMISPMAIPDTKSDGSFSRRGALRAVRRAPLRENRGS